MGKQLFVELKLPRNQTSGDFDNEVLHLGARCTRLPHPLHTAQQLWNIKTHTKFHFYSSSVYKCIPKHVFENFRLNVHSKVYI